MELSSRFHFPADSPDILTQKRCWNGNPASASRQLIPGLKMRIVTEVHEHADPQLAPKYDWPAKPPDQIYQVGPRQFWGSGCQTTTFEKIDILGRAGYKYVSSKFVGQVGKPMRRPRRFGSVALVEKTAIIHGQTGPLRSGRPSLHLGPA